MEQVFISYSRKDYLNQNDQVIPGNIVSQITDALTKEGISFWFDKNGITHGDAFATKIVEHIRDCHVFLFISSENSNKSDWTSREIAAANELHKKIIPFRYDRSPYDDSVMLYLATLDRVDFFRNPDTAIRSLVEAIHRQLDEIQKEEIRKKREEEERKRREEEQRRRAEELASVSRELTVLGQKRNELADDIDAASKSLEGKNARLKEMDTSLETLRSRQAKLLGRGNEEPKPQPKPADNVFTRGWEDIQRHWRSNPMLVNVFVVLAICALAYLIFYLYGSTLSSYAKSIKTPQGKRSFSYEYAFMVGSVLASAWGG